AFTSPCGGTNGRVDRFERDMLYLARRGLIVLSAVITLVLFAATAPGLVSTLTTTDMPGRSIPRSATSPGTEMRTGSRCTILVKLPVALSGGSSENTEPEAGATLTTLPVSLRLEYASTEIETGWPGCRSASCVSLKFAST